MSYLDGGGGDDDEDDAVEASGSALRRLSDMRFQRSRKQIIMRRATGTGPPKTGGLNMRSISSKVSGQRGTW
jgi:hypothetical protein